MAEIEAKDELMDDDNIGLDQEPEDTALAPVPEPGSTGITIADASHPTGVTGTMKIPQLRMAHGVGSLSAAGFSPGELVLGSPDDGGAAVVYSPAKRGEKDSAPAHVIILSAREYWKEIPPQGTTDFSQVRTFATEQEALAAGMRTQWPPRGSALDTRENYPNCARAVQLTLLIREPEGVEDRSVFFIPLKEKDTETFWTLGTFYVERHGYTEVAPEIRKAELFTHRVTGLASAVWELRSKQKLFPKTGNHTWIPSIRLCGTLTPDVMDSIRKLIAG